jgi:PTS system mannitol-specific IIC component
LLLPVIIGNICALSFFTLTDFGLVAPASPGSLISIILMSPRGRTLIGILGVFIATAISFLLSIPIIKARPDFQGENENAPSAEDGASIKPLPGTIRKIVFACDAGMGSSALGATRFKARLMKNGLGSITCTNSAVDSIPDDADIVVCQSNLADRVHGHEVVRITNFISDPALDSLLARLGKGTEEGVLRIKNILTGLPSESKEDAILRAGHMLEASGYVESGYAESMLEREKVASTYMGMGLAIPHGTSETKALVRESGIVVLQYPDGVDFGEEKARLVIGIAGAGDAHLDILAKISSALDDEEVLERLSVTSDPEDILKTLE